MRISRVGWTGMIFLVCWCSAVWAHRPLIDERFHGDAAHTLEIGDISISQVVYQELTAKQTQLWLTFEARQGEELDFQLGMPELENQKDFRPSLALIGPNLPNIDLPLEIPAGAGAQVFSSEGVTRLEEFHEPFTDTKSWILAEASLTVTASGRYYLVAYVPSGKLGKLWVAVGTREVFGLSDIAAFPAWTGYVRQFHAEPGQVWWMKIFTGVTLILLLIIIGWVLYRL